MASGACLADQRARDILHIRTAQRRKSGCKRWRLDRPECIDARYAFGQAAGLSALGDRLGKTKHRLARAQGSADRDAPRLDGLTCHAC